MTSVYPRPDLVRVLQVAATSPHQVPQLLDQLDDLTVQEVVALSEGLGRLARDVVNSRRVQDWWNSAGARIPAAGTPWTGADPEWPGDNPAPPAGPWFTPTDTAGHGTDGGTDGGTVDGGVIGAPPGDPGDPGDADRTQVIPSGAVTPDPGGTPH